MGRTGWIVIAMGFVAISFFIVAMFATLDSFKDTPAGQRTLLAEKTSREFGFAVASLALHEEGGRKTFRLAYETHADSKLDLSLQRAEMEKAAEFVFRHYTGKDRRQIARISVRRTEVKGGGCWKESYVSEAVFENPDLAAPPPPSVMQ